MPKPFQRDGFGIFLIWGIAALLFIALALSAVFYRRYRKV